MLIASTGFRRAADRAGANPEIIPIIEEMSSPKIILPKVNEIFSSVILVTIRLPAKINNRPIAPPIRARITDSNKNCERMKYCFAHRAF